MPLFDSPMPRVRHSMLSMHNTSLRARHLMLPTSMLSTHNTPPRVRHSMLSTLCYVRVAVSSLGAPCIAVDHLHPRIIVAKLKRLLRMATYVQSPNTCSALNLSNG